MNRAEILLAGLLTALIIAGVAYQEYRGAPMGAEVITASRGTTPFDAESAPHSPGSTPILLAPTHTPATPAAAQQPGLAFLNRADSTTLQAIPGIGEVIAQRIVAARQQMGGFQRMRDLLEVNGIGSSRLADIQQYIQRNQASQQGPQTLGEGTSAGWAKATGTISLNHATQQQLMAVSGIGEALSEAILTARKRSGDNGFRNWAEVEAVSGIGEARLATLQKHFSLP